MSGKLKEVRERMKSVSSTQQITKAMKMVSASKLRRAQQAITEMRPYANRLDKMMKNIVYNLDGDFNSPFVKTRELKKVAVLVITSNRGLCGAFNANILKLAFFYAKEHYAEQYEAGNLSFLCIGKKGFDYFRRRFPKATFIDQYLTLYSNHNFEKIAALADRLMIDFQNSTFDQLELYYGRFKNAGTQFPEREQYLPVGKLEVESNVKTGMKADYIFEPNQQQLLEELIPSILQTQLFKCLLDTQASEHGARMTAMDKATENANELLNGLKLSYNRARQAAITTELIEIISGVEALK